MSSVLVMGIGGGGGGGLATIVVAISIEGLQIDGAVTSRGAGSW